MTHAVRLAAMRFGISAIGVAVFVATTISFAASVEIVPGRIVAVALDEVGRAAVVVPLASGTRAYTLGAASVGIFEVRWSDGQGTVIAGSCGGSKTPDVWFVEYDAEGGPHVLEIRGSAHATAELWLLEAGAAGPVESPEATGFPSLRLLNGLRGNAERLCDGRIDALRVGSYGVPRRWGALPPQSDCGSIRSVPDVPRCARAVLGDLWSCFTGSSPGPLAAERALSVFLDDAIAFEAAVAASRGDCDWVRRQAPVPEATARARGLIEDAFGGNPGLEASLPTPRPDYAHVRKGLRSSCAGRRLLEAVGDSAAGVSGVGLSRLFASLNETIEAWSGLLVPPDASRWVSAAEALHGLPRWACRPDVAVLVLLDERLSRLEDVGAKGHRPVSVRSVLRQSRPRPGTDVADWLRARFPDSYSEVTRLLDETRSPGQ